jgi:heme-degrading monooxygenase HmoA
MIKHIVMWNVRGDTVEERQIAIDRLKSSFEKLVGHVPGLSRLEIGADISRVDYACDVVLYSEFESRDALAAYADHPAHLKARDDVKELRIARHQVDYEVVG